MFCDTNIKKEKSEVGTKTDFDFQNNNSINLFAGNAPIQTASFDDNYEKLGYNYLVNTNNFPTSDLYKLAKSKADYNGTISKNNLAKIYRLRINSPTNPSVFNGLKGIELFSLKSLTIFNCSLSSEDIERISSIPTLETLELYNCDIKSVGWIKKLPNIKEVNLANHFGSEKQNQAIDYQELFAVSTLKSLNLLGNDLSGINDFMFQLPSGLENIDLTGSKIVGLEVDHFNKLTKLSLADNELTIGEIDKLNNADFSNLVSLNLDNTKVGNKLNLDFSNLPKLKELSLNKNNLGDHAKTLKTRSIDESVDFVLELAGNEISDDILKTIFDNNSFAYFGRINLNNNKITSSGFQHIEDTEMNELFLNNNQVSKMSLPSNSFMLIEVEAIDQYVEYHVPVNSDGELIIDNTIGELSYFCFKETFTINMQLEPTGSVPAALNEETAKFKWVLPNALSEAPQGVEFLFSHPYLVGGPELGRAFNGKIKIIPTPLGGTKYSVSYNANGADLGEVPLDGESYSAGSTVKVKEKGTLDYSGYEFIGWKINNTGSLLVPGTLTEDFVIDGNVELFAQWKVKATQTTTTVATTTTTTTILPESTTSAVYTTTDTTTAIVPGTTTVTSSATRAKTTEKKQTEKSLESTQSSKQSTSTVTQTAEEPNEEKDKTIVEVRLDKEQSIKHLKERQVPAVKIGNGEVYLHGFTDAILSLWSFFNLLITIIAFIIAGYKFMIIVIPQNHKTESKKYKTNMMATIAVIASGIIMLIITLVVSEFSGVMVLFDKWSIWLFIIFIAQCTTLMFSERKDGEKKNTKETMDK